MSGHEDQDEVIEQFKYSIKYEPTQNGVRVHMKGQGNNLAELGTELLDYYPKYLESLKQKGTPVAPLQPIPKAVKETTQK